MSKETYLPSFDGCLVCGEPNVNPSTLNRRFKVTDDGVQVNFTADHRQVGYIDIVHGGIICALLDETIGWAVAVQRKQFFVTGELTVRFVRSLPIGLEVTVYGRAVEHKSRYSVAEGEIKDDQGTVYARATGKFFYMKDDAARRMNSYLTYQNNDLNVLDGQ
jgi:uncharacterized protein (TIGR00369 family)